MWFVTKLIFFIRNRIIRIRCRVIGSKEIPCEANASQKYTKEPKENTWCYTLFVNVVGLHLDLEILLNLNSPQQLDQELFSCSFFLSVQSYRLGKRE